MKTKTSNTEEIRQNLLGCLETALFMRGGSERFHVSAKALHKSFLVPLLVFPATVLFVLAGHPGALNDTTANILIAMHIVRFIVSLVAFLGFVYFMAKTLDRTKSFYRFVIANNWLSLPATILMIPLFALYFNGAYAWEEVYPLMVIVTLYSYAYTGYMVAQVMRVPWELAAFVSICGMAIHQSTLGLVKWATVNTLYLIS